MFCLIQGFLNTFLLIVQGILFTKVNELWKMCLYALFNQYSSAILGNQTNLQNLWIHKVGKLSKHTGKGEIINIQESQRFKYTTSQKDEINGVLHLVRTNVQRLLVLIYINNVLFAF